MLVAEQIFCFPRPSEFAIRWCRIWGFAIPEICIMSSHNTLVFGAKIMNRLLLRKWFASQMLIFDAGGVQIRQN